MAKLKTIRNEVQYFNNDINNDNNNQNNDSNSNNNNNNDKKMLDCVDRIISLMHNLKTANVPQLL